MLQKLLKSQTYFMYFISATERDLNCGLRSISLKTRTQLQKLWKENKQEEIVGLVH